jgi:hypothetical protein
MAEEGIKKETEVPVENDEKTLEQVKILVTEEDIKKEAEVPVETDEKTLEQVKDRLKFFFSDANVRQDFFVRKLLTSEEGETPGKVPIEALLRFNTIKQYTTEPSVVVAAAKALSDKLVLDEKETAIGRVAAFTNDLMNGNIPLSLYVRNLPVKDVDSDSPRYDCKIDDIRKLFQAYGDVAIVKLKFTKHKSDQGDDDLGANADGKKPYKKKRFPIGHAMVEFHTKECLDKAAGATLTMKGGEKQDPQDKISLGENTLDIMLLEEYIPMRKQEKAKEDEENKGQKRGRDDDEEEAGGEDEGEGRTFTFDWKPGCVIKLKGLSGACDREAMLAMLAKGMDIPVSEVMDKKVYADYSRGQPDGAIRFPDFDDSIAKLADRLKAGELEISDAKVEDAKVLDGDEEKEYWTNFIEFKNRQIRHKEEEKRNRRNRKKKKGRNW